MPIRMTHIPRVDKIVDLPSMAELNGSFSQQKTSRLAERIDRIEKLLTDNLLRESGMSLILKAL